MTTDARFTSRLTTILTMAGLAIGVGNVWRFPYMMGQNGGSAFLLIYVIFMILLAVPALSSEWALGRATRAGPIVALQNALGRRFGTVMGLIMVFSVFMAMTYYNVVVGKVLYSAWFAASRGFDAASLPAYAAGLERHGVQYLFAVGMLLTGLWIVHRGLRAGIEKANTLLVPLFGLAAVYLVVVTLNLDGALDHLADFLKPDFSKAPPSVWFAAMGQVCFSVGLSGTIGVMYGAYLRDDARIVPTAAATCATDLGAALLAALFVVPAVLVFSIDMAAGPDLLFKTMPQLFAQMPGGRWLAPMFLLGWALVAMLSIIASIDTIGRALADLTGRRFGRHQWLWTTGLLLGLATGPVAFNQHWIGVLDMLFGSGMFMVGALVSIIAIGWGLGTAVTRTQVAIGLGPGLQTWMVAWIRYVMPVALAVILGGFILSKVTGT